MKRLASFFILGILLWSCFFFAVPSASARSYRTKSSDVYVRGYTRKNGTYVKPYYRSKKDGFKYNNYSCIDSGRC